MSIRASCVCDTPSPWEDNYGNQTNMCKVCKGEITEPVTDELGRLIIAFEAACRPLTFKDADERKAFVDQLIKGLPKRLQHNLQMWRNNRAAAKSESSN